MRDEILLQRGKMGAGLNAKSLPLREQGEALPETIRHSTLDPGGQVGDETDEEASRQPERHLSPLDGRAGAVRLGIDMSALRSVRRNLR